jgi:hypothetical protein
METVIEVVKIISANSMQVIVIIYLTLNLRLNTALKGVLITGLEMVNAMNHAIMRAAIGIAEIVIKLKTALKDALTDGLEMVNAMNHAIMRAAIGIVKIVLEFSKMIGIMMNTIGMMMNTIGMMMNTIGMMIKMIGIMMNTIGMMRKTALLDVLLET